MRRLWIVLLGCSLVVLTAHSARASAILVDTASFSGTALPIGLTPFDPTLGTLDSVAVSIVGTLSVAGLAPSFVVPGPGAAPVPMPYSYRVRVDQDFDGTGSSYFDFTTPAQYLLDGAATGSGDAFTLVSPFSYWFQFTAATDLAGFTLPAFSGPTLPPVSITGTRSAFLETIFSPAEFVLMTHTATGLALTGPVPTISSVASAGVITVEYRYTPRTVPEPSATALMLLPLALAVQRARRSAAGLDLEHWNADHSSEGARSRHPLPAGGQADAGTLREPLRAAAE
jgi:hypothetical protein